jgi:hypothetical protein
MNQFYLYWNATNSKRFFAPLQNDNLLEVGGFAAKHPILKTQLIVILSEPK